MSYAPAHPDADSLKKPFVCRWIPCFTVRFSRDSTLFSHRGELWEARVATTPFPWVSSPGFPNHAASPDAVTTSRVVDTSKGLYKSEPQPKPRKWLRHEKNSVFARKNSSLRIASVQSFGGCNSASSECRSVRRWRFTGLAVLEFLNERRIARWDGISGPGGGDFTGKFLRTSML